MKLRETSHCPNCDQLTQRVAKLEEKLLEAMERIARLEEEIATCAQQGRAVFRFLLDSVQAHLCGTPPPSLLSSGP